jgi:hypothetical protein
MVRIAETYTHDGILVDYVDSDGHHYLDAPGVWRVEPLDVAESLAISKAEWLAAQSSPPTIGERLARVEVSVQELDAIIVAVLS